MSYDPDLGLDGDPAASDCNHGNDRDHAVVSYLAECPW